MCGRALLALLVCVLAAPAAVAQAAPPRVDAMVVYRDGDVVGPKRVAVGAARSGSCRLREGLPIGVLAALRQRFAARGSCANLYVHTVGRDRAFGAQGWVFKVGRRLPSQ